MAYKVNIKHMVCPRCITAVSQIFTRLNIPIIDITLGEVLVEESLKSHQKVELSRLLNEVGFELLEDKQIQVIESIKHTIINQIHKVGKFDDKIVYSELLSNTLNKDYSVLSKLFSSIEGMTIERYILKQKIERVKELLFYNELSLSEIASQLQYSSVAHLSAQFKRETGMTPTQFKKMQKPGHRALDF